MDFDKLKRLNILHEDLINTVVIKEVLSLEDQSTGNLVPKNDWVYEFFANTHPLFWSKWLKVIYELGEIPVTFKADWHIPPFSWPNRKSWYDIFKEETLGHWPLSRLKQFWAFTEDKPPETLEEFLTKANQVDVRKLIVNVITWHFNLVTKTRLKHKFSNEYETVKLPDYDELNDHLLNDPTWYFWGLKELRCTVRSKANAKQLLHHSDELLQLLENIFFG